MIPTSVPVPQLIHSVACRPSRIESVGSTATQPGEQSQAQRPAPWELFGIPAGKGLTVPDNVVLIMRFHPVGGEDVSVMSEDFTGEYKALEAVARALDERRSLVLRHARYDREADETWYRCGYRGQTARRLGSTSDYWPSRGETW
jgi:hypothetical protein